MGEMTRQDRVNLHKKQERVISSTTEPDIAALKEGVPTIRQTSEGTVEFTKINNSLVKKVLNPSAAISDLSTSSGSGLANNANVTTTVPTLADLQTALTSINTKINSIIKTLREQKLIG